LKAFQERRAQERRAPLNFAVCSNQFGQNLAVVTCGLIMPTQIINKRQYIEQQGNLR